ncbi:MAG: ribonuclease III [Paludibacter sp.]|nr:ribonuclease III [Paludibacter sp.]
MIKYLIRNIRLFSNSRKEPYLLFHKVLGFYPGKIEYYQLAVRHRSVSIPTDNGLPLSNERLEFLGDAVLNSVVTDILYRRFETQREGFLTNTRSKIVKRESLNKLAFELGLDQLILSSKHVNTHTNNNIYGNALEALLGAIYLDYGYKKCKSFVENRLLKSFVDIDEIANGEVNFKSKIIEWSQKHRISIEFLLVEEQVIAGNKHKFATDLQVVDKIVCRGFGSSKKASQQDASRRALQIFRENPQLESNILNITDEPVRTEENPDPNI